MTAVKLTGGLKGDGSNEIEFLEAKDFKALPYIRQVMTMDSVLRDLTIKRNHMLVVCIFGWFGRPQDEGELSWALGNFRRALEFSGVDLPKSIDRLAFEHWRDGCFPLDTKPCHICDRMTHRR